MTWKQIVEYDYVDVEPVKRRGTKKKVWDESTNAWKDVTIWTVATLDNGQLKWLEENYPNRAGWGPAGFGKWFMEEVVYIHYCLKFG